MSSLCEVTKAENWYVFGCSVDEKAEVVVVVEGNARCNASSGWRVEWEWEVIERTKSWQGVVQTTGCITSWGGITSTSGAVRLGVGQPAAKMN